MENKYSHFQSLLFLLYFRKTKNMSKDVGKRKDQNDEEKLPANRVVVEPQKVPLEISHDGDLECHSLYLHHNVFTFMLTAGYHKVSLIKSLRYVRSLRLLKCFYDWLYARYCLFETNRKHMRGENVAGQRESVFHTQNAKVNLIQQQWFCEPISSRY